MMGDAYNPCQCDQCVELRKSDNPEAIEFMEALDEMERERYLAQFTIIIKNAFDEIDRICGEKK